MIDYISSVYIYIHIHIFYYIYILLHIHKFFFITYIYYIHIYFLQFLIVKSIETFVVCAVSRIKLLLLLLSDRTSQPSSPVMVDLLIY